MYDVKCYLCGANRFAVLFTQQGKDPYLNLICSTLQKVKRNWVVCKQCGFVYRNPVLDNVELKRLYECYEQDVFTKIDQDDYFDRIVTLPHNLSENWGKVNWLVNSLTHLNKNEKISRVLDIGCGGGTLLYTLRKRMFFKEICGVELNSAYANLATRRLKVNIRNEPYLSGLFKDSFDLLICTKVLEHISDPRPFLKEMSHDLNCDGLLFLEVPDLSDMFILPLDNERFFIPHIYFFSINTLSELLIEAGFSILKYRVSTTCRNRSYLQILAIKNDDDKPSIPPFDDPLQIAYSVIENIKQHGKE